MAKGRRLDVGRVDFSLFLNFKSMISRKYEEVIKNMYVIKKKFIWQKVMKVFHCKVNLR